MRPHWSIAVLALCVASGHIAAQERAGDARQAFAVAAVKQSTGDSRDGTPIVTALQEQLGLKLEAQRAPVEFLIIDRIERPSPD